VRRLPGWPAAADQGCLGSSQRGAIDPKNGPSDREKLFPQPGKTPSETCRAGVARP
jgi:hypothetical protein